jgi:hypothetical protein
LRGRRRGPRREGDESQVYVDRYSSREWLLVLLLVGLSCLDMVLTLIYLDQGGEEANPLMAWALEHGEHVFMTIKIGITVLGALVLLLHVRFRLVRVCLTGIVVAYTGLVLFHLLTWIPAILEIT